MIFGNLIDKILKYVFYLIVILLPILIIGAGIYCSVELYKNITATSQTFGEIHQHDIFEDFNIFDCDLSDAIFYKTQTGYEYTTKIEKSVEFNGDLKKYNVLINNTPSNYEQSSGGILTAQNIINYYEIDGSQNLQTILNITIKFYLSNIEITIANNNDATQQAKFLEYVKFNGLKLKIIDVQYNILPHKTKLSQEKPSGVTCENITNTSITVQYIEGAEYKIDGLDTWQDSNVFTGLKPNTSYIIYVRYKETITHNASEPTYISRITLKNEQLAPTSAKAVEITESSITIEKQENCEYSLDNRNWQDSPIFTNLNAGSTYAIYVRFKETNMAYASNSFIFHVTTLNSSSVKTAGYYSSNQEDLLYSWQEMIDANYFSTQEAGINNYIMAGENIPTTQGYLVIDNSITAVNFDAFKNWTCLLGVQFPEGFTTIEASAFEGCSNLQSINLPTTLINIGNSAFKGCSELAVIEIPNGIQYINSKCFADCYNLSKVVLPNSTISVDEYAFMNCYNLKSVTILNDNAFEINTNAFVQCGNLTAIYVPAESLESYKTLNPTYAEIIYSIQ